MFFAFSFFPSLFSVIKKRSVPTGNFGTQNLKMVGWTSYRMSIQYASRGIATKIIWLGMLIFDAKNLKLILDFFFLPNCLNMQ